MIDWLTDILDDFLLTIRLADVVDIIVVATIIYLIMMWLRESTSESATRRAMVVLMLFIGVNLLARLYDMYLFQRIMQVLGLVLLFATVVIFQSDIRRMLDRIATWHTSRGKGTPRRGIPVVDTITEAVARMAETRTGALIAIKGKEPWEYHIQGGIDLRGIVSQPLLYSIFQKDTPGHDGAVLIEGHHVHRFAAHLPLATNTPEASKYGGTRHAAALGLAELCDAFVIAVSEERGTISVAENGRMDEVATAGELKVRLDRFWRTHYTNAKDARRIWLTPRSFRFATLSLAFATLLWFQFAYSPDMITRMYNVPVEFRNLPPEWEIVEPLPAERQISITGSEQAFELINTSELAISLDMSDPVQGWSEVAISREHIELPPGLELNRVDPPELQIRTRQLRTLQLPVTVPTRGTLAASLSIAGIQADPDSITVLAPEGMADLPDRIYTAPINLSRITETATFSSRLELPEGLRLPPDAVNEVEVDVRVVPAGTAE